MDNQTLSIKTFLESLTEDQADMCERDEKQLAEIFSSGWSEATSVQFHRVMLHARRANSAATVEGVFEAVLRLGLLGLCEALAKPQKTPKRRVRGV